MDISTPGSLSGYKKIEDEASAIKKTLGGSSKPFYLYVLHNPENENETIVPLQGRWTTRQYLQNFTHTIAPFLSTCGELQNVCVLHFYKNDSNSFRNNLVKTEKPVIFFNYSFLQGKLQPLHTEYEQHEPMSYFDPAQNTELTLGVSGKNNNIANVWPPPIEKSFNTPVDVNPVLCINLILSGTNSGSLKLPEEYLRGILSNLIKPLNLKPCLWRWPMSGRHSAKLR